MNAIPVSRPEAGVLLQDWSTPTTQTMNSRIAAVPRSFSHMVEPSVMAREPARPVGGKLEFPPTYCREAKSAAVTATTPARVASAWQPASTRVACRPERLAIRRR
jgi:hypothetical protein